NLINSRRIRNCSNATRCANGLTRGRAQPTSRDLSVPVFTSRSAAADRQSRRLHQSAAFPHPKLYAPLSHGRTPHELAGNGRPSPD
ncbi:unnamed protein product, partial [Tenebrio molitor]